VKNILVGALIPLGILIGYVARSLLPQEPSTQGDSRVSTYKEFGSRIRELEDQQRALSGELQSAKRSEIALAVHNQTQQEGPLSDAGLTSSSENRKIDPYSAEERLKAQLELQTRQETLLRRHQNEPVDPSWAVPMTESLEKSLNEVTPTIAAMPHSIHCKTSICVATFKWSNYDSAIKNYTGADISSTECSRFMLLTEPKDKEAPYSTDLILDCKRP